MSSDLVLTLARHCSRASHRITPQLHYEINTEIIPFFR